jgi:uncharacterized protein involved in exopolysaccharide biosynthesis
VGSPSPDLSLRNVLTVLFKYWRRAAWISAAVFAAGAVLTFALPRVYEARATVLVKFGHEYVVRPQVGEQRPLISMTPEEVLNSEAQILSSEDLVTGVIRTITVDRMYRFLLQPWLRGTSRFDAARKVFEKNLSVEVVKRSSILRVAFRHRDPQIAAEVVNLLVERYQEKHVRVYADTQTDFLDTQLKTYETSLRESERKLEGFRQQNGVYSHAEQMSLLLRRKADLEGSYRDAGVRLRQIESRIEALRGELAAFAKNPDLHTETEREKVVTDAKIKLLVLQLKERELVDKYKEDHPQVQDVRQQVAVVKRFLQEQESEIGTRVRTANPVFQDVQKEVMRAVADRRSEAARIASLRTLLVDVEDRIRQLDLSERELDQIRRELTVNEKNYQLYRGKFEETRISNDMNQRKIANISVVQTASPPTSPVRPRVLLSLLAAAALGVLSGVLYAFAADHLSQTVSTPDAAERRLGLPVLAAVSLKEGP